MASLIFRRWRLLTLPWTGQVFLHASTLAAGFLALIWTGKSETLLVCFGLWFAAFAHGLGHTVAARLLGEWPESITLYPAWSSTRLVRPPARIAHDLVVTAAGPLTNGLLGAAFLLTFDGLLAREPAWLGQWARIQTGFGFVMLLPVFPLDGSRLLRLTLKLRFPETRAWEIAGFVSQAASAGVVLWSLIQGFWSIALVGIVLYLGGRFSTFILEFVKRAKEAERSDRDEWGEGTSEEGDTITLTQTADGVWEQLDPSPSNEFRTYF